MTNYELAKNSSFPIAVTFLGCSQCNYLTNRAGSTSTQVPCPKCNAQGLPRLIFPSTSCVKLLEMVAYFYAKAYDRVENLQDKLVNDLYDKVGQIYEPEFAIKTVSEIQNLYKKSGKGQAEYDQMLEIIRKHLCLQSIEEVKSVFVTLFRYSDTFEEHKVVVILTCTLLERLFSNLLTLILTCKGMTRTEAIKKIRKLGDFKKRCKEFKDATGISLEETIGKCSIPNFFSDWQEVRKARNNFVHGTPYAIGVTTSEKAFNLAKNAFSVFAYLQNRFCVMQTGVDV